MPLDIWITGFWLTGFQHFLLWSYRTAFPASKTSGSAAAQKDISCSIGLDNTVSVDDFLENDDFHPNILQTAHCVSYLVTKYDCNLASKQMLTQSCSAVTAHIVPPLPHRNLLLRCKQESKASWRSSRQKMVRTINFGLKNFSTQKTLL